MYDIYRDYFDYLIREHIKEYGTEDKVLDVLLNIDKLKDISLQQKFKQSLDEAIKNITTE